MLTFATNLDRLADTPPRYGWDWTGSLGGGFDPAPSVMTEALVADRSLAGVAGGNYFDMAIGGRTITAVTFDQLKGTIGPVILEGRAPRRDHELALGTRTLNAAGLAIGDRVRVKLEEQPTTMRIVGRAVFPRLGAGSFTPTDLGEGAAMTNTGALKLVNIDTRETNDPDARYSVYFVRAARGVSFQVLAAGLSRKLGGIIEECSNQNCMSGPQRPGDIVAYGRVRSTGTALAALLALTASAALAHSLMTSMRRRRRDVAILKTLGFVGRDVSNTARWQALALAGTALVVGIPLGLLVGRGLWTIFAHELGVADHTSIPAGPVAFAIPATLILASIVATIPGRLARRTRPAIVLRSP